jgi:hypothetical protein
MKLNILLLLLLSVPSFGNAPDSTVTNLPRSVGGAHDLLLKLLPDSVLLHMRKGSECDMVRYNFGIGTWMRRTWAFEDSSSDIHRFFDSGGVTNPESMSGLILATFWCRLNGEPLLLTERIQRSRQHNELLQHGFGCLDSICILDGSRFRVKSFYDKLGPPYRFHVLLECRRAKHRWAYETGRPLFRPDSKQLVDFAREKWSGCAKPVRGHSVPIPPGRVVRP